MTKKHDQQHPDVDAGVRKAYRDLAVETAPDHLNRAVLQAARTATRPKYARARAWTRPLAWAATIVLTVAVVVEINRVPAPDGAPEHQFAPVSENQAEISTAAEAEPTANSANDQLQVPAATQKAMPLPDSPAPSAAAPVVLEEPVATGRQAAALVESAVESRREITIDLESQTRELLQAADPAAQPQAAALRSSAPAAVADDVACPEDTRATPETWLECILELETAGLSDTASAQRRLLEQAFPEFQPP